MSIVTRLLLVPLLGLCCRPLSAQDDWIDRLRDKLSFATADGDIRGRISGTLELAALYTSETRADLRFDDRDFLFAPRLSVFLDSDVGTRTYVFAQARFDRGFDPADRSLEKRLDEIAVRFAVLEENRLNLQLGKFATVFGAWPARHLAWENPFVSAPLAFEHLTPMWDDRATLSAPLLLRRAHLDPLSGSTGIASDKHRRMPAVWGPVYASGAALTGRLGRLDYALEAKNAPLGSRPGSWDLDARPWGRPAWAARIGWRPDVRWDMGVSAARGTYLTRAAAASAPAGTSASDHEQITWAFDMGFAHRHLQIWAEIHQTRFEVPGIDRLDTLAAYLEAKYAFSPIFHGAVRLSGVRYSAFEGPNGVSMRWGRDVARLDLVAGWRLSAHMRLKLEYSPQHEHPAPRRISHAVALQFVTRF
jgi:hypothetical protein